MSLEGLDYILNKREVVATVNTQDMLERPEQVEADYRRHVRTYVPISRAAEGDGEHLSVVQFERKVIKAVKAAQCPRGYLTAEYGYGKTSTALYLWDRAEHNNLVVVPPFQMLHLPDLITATHGWLRHKLNTTRPDLVTQADDLYTEITSKSISSAARESNAREATLREWAREGRFILDLQTPDYLRYFEGAVQLAQEAGFDGLIILPDEIQQYIEPQMRSGGGDPIAPFFNLVQGLATREGYLNFGFIMVIPLKEIGVIREARGRGDLLQRMYELSLDLSTVYDQHFARRLWDKLAQEFDYVDVSDQIVRPETLVALGEIASREDLSNGPRTVINTFKRMVQRFMSQSHSGVQPYTPLDLVDDLLSGGIQFQGNNQIQNVTRQALRSATVQRELERFEPAIKLAAAFPNEGAPIDLQRAYEVEDAFDELQRIALGELVISVGPIDARGVTLAGLDRVQLQRDWLPQTIRDFRRAYAETHNDTRDRAIEAFQTLLKARVFKGDWKITEEQPSTLTSNCSIIFEGHFPSFATRFPRRRVQVRIYWEDEARKDAHDIGDVVIEYRLSIHRDLEVEQRRSLAVPLQLHLDEHTAIIPINLLYVRPEGVPQQIQQRLQGVWSPYDLSPLVFMNIYQMLEDKRAANLIPKQDDQYIQHGFQPDLLDNILRDLFNANVGSPLDVAADRITEAAIERLLEARYGDNYQTLIVAASWRSSLQKYHVALERLENRFQRRGEIAFEGTKEETAKLMALSNTGLDSFMRSFGALLQAERDWPTQRQQERGETGAVRFTLHPQERRIMEWLSQSSKTKTVTVGGKSQAVKSLDLSDLYTRSRELGYQDEEIQQLIILLGKRDLAELHQHHDQQYLSELPSLAPDVEGVSTALGRLEETLSILRRAFPKDGTLADIEQHAGQWRERIQEQLENNAPDPELLYRIGQTIRTRQRDIENLAAEKRKAAVREHEALLRGLLPIRSQHLQYLERAIEGSVSYVDQVNTLRTALLKQARDLSAEVNRFRSSIEQIGEVLKREDLGHTSLVAQVQKLSRYKEELDALNNEVRSFEQQHDHLSAWERLVGRGSALFVHLSEMENAVKEHAQKFDHLSRDIRGDISSQSNRLNVLPNHTIYENRLAVIERDVLSIREQAQTGFAEKQNRYRFALADSGLYRRDDLWPPFEYNFTNPGESYRLLETQVQDMILKACERMTEIITEYRHGVTNTLNTPYLQEIPSEDRGQIERDGVTLSQQIEAVRAQLDNAQQVAQDISSVQDFAAPDEGEFAALIVSLVSVRSSLGDIDRQAKKLGRWLTQFKLTPEQEQLLGNLAIEDMDNTEELVEWQQRSGLSHDEFWQHLRGLYEKRRIRLAVGRVRF